MGTASSLDGKAASITQQSGSITYKDQINSYDFTATVTGKIRVWLTEVYSGTSFRLLAQNDLNATIKSASNVENNGGITVDVTAGKTYKINVSEYYGTGTYVLNIADQKETVDISEYTTVNDKIEYKDQRIVYTYTPKVSGTYRFDMNEIVSSSVVSIRIFNRLNETVKSNTYCGNRDGVTANLEANETYTITVEQNVEMCNYTMSIGIPHDAVDVSEYTSVKDKITFADQTNLYKFTPKTTGKHNFMINDLNGSSVVYLILYNRLDEKLTSDSYCESGDSITYELTAGETYTVAVKFDFRAVRHTHLILGAAVVLLGHRHHAIAVEIALDKGLRLLWQFSIRDHLVVRHCRHRHKRQNGRKKSSFHTNTILKFTQ
jgi:hypothetical protein